MPRTATRLSPAVMNGNDKYMSNGVTVSPAIPTVGEKAKIIYDGILSKSGASHVYAHIGYGSKWESIYDYPMTKTGMGFEASVPIAKSDTLNVCFKDCANNWDNNSGRNYSFDVEM